MRVESLQAWTDYAFTATKISGALRSTLALLIGTGSECTFIRVGVSH